MNGGVQRRSGWNWRRSAVCRIVFLFGLGAFSTMCGLAGPIGYAASNAEDSTADWRQFGVGPAGRIEELAGSGITEAWQFELWETETPIEELLSGLVVVGGYSLPTSSPSGYSWGSSSDHDSAWAQYVAASNALRGLSPEGLPLTSGTTGASATRSAAVSARGDRQLSFLRAGSMERVSWSDFLQSLAVPSTSAVAPVAASMPMSRTYRLAAYSPAPAATFAMAEPAPVPEPGSIVLGALGLVAASVLRRRAR